MCPTQPPPPKPKASLTHIWFIALNGLATEQDLDTIEHDARENDWKYVYVTPPASRRRIPLHVMLNDLTFCLDTGILSRVRLDEHSPRRYRLG